MLLSELREVKNGRVITHDMAIDADTTHGNAWSAASPSKRM